MAVVRCAALLATTALGVDAFMHRMQLSRRPFVQQSPGDTPACLLSPSKLHVRQSARRPSRALRMLEDGADGRVENDKSNNVSGPWGPMGPQGLVALRDDTKEPVTLV